MLKCSSHTLQAIENSLINTSSKALLRHKHVPTHLAQVACSLLVDEQGSKPRRVAKYLQQGSSIRTHIHST